MSIARSEELIQVEMAVAVSLEEKYGTNNPTKTYEQGVYDALHWVLGGPQPHNHIEEKQMELNQSDERVLENWIAGTVKAEVVPEVPLVDAEYENDRLLLLAHESPTLGQMVRDTLAEMDEHGDSHHAIWLGSFQVGRPRTQVQLVITQNPDLWIDED